MAAAHPVAAIKVSSRPPGNGIVASIGRSMVAGKAAVGLSERNG